MVERLTRVLAARGVPAQDRDDLLQETALRLYRVWDTIDPQQPVWPYAVTIALNLWRDSLRASGPQLRSVDASTESGHEPVACLDVERTVIARQELADVGAALRMLAPEQRRLVLETEELSAVVHPLRASERMSRMRVRRELARVVGRASAIAALVWLRRPHRAQAMAAVAFTGALAASVFTGSPAVSVTSVVPLAPSTATPVAEVVHPVIVVHRVVVHRARVVHVAAPVHHVAARPAARPTTICAPAATQAPAEAPPATEGPAAAANDTLTTAVDSLTAALPQQSYVTVPTARATDNGCVEVG